MKILAIDTTENTASAAVCEDEKLLALYTLTQTRTHSETMLPMVRSLLDSLRLTVDDLDLLVCAAGPGSFTGVRIGAATVKGLAFGKNKPCMGVSALEAMAYSMKDFCGILCPGMDARRGQLYQASFLSDGKTLTRLTEDRVIMAEDLKNEILTDPRYAGKKICLCGGGYGIMKKVLPEEIVAVTPEIFRYENAQGAAICAYRKYVSDPSSACTDVTLQPIYLRPSQAEREREEKNQ